MTIETKQSAHLTIENLLHLLICLAILISFTIYAILPLYTEYTELNSKLCKIKSDQMKVTILLPLYSELVSHASQPKMVNLTAPPFAPLHKENFADIHESILVMSEQSGMNLLKTVPHVHTLDNKKQRLLGVDISVEGAFCDMRMLLQKIFQIPSFYHLEGVTIAKGVYQERMDIEVWLFIK